MSANKNLWIRIVNGFSGNSNDVPLEAYVSNIHETPAIVINSPLNFFGYNFINPNITTSYIKLWQGSPDISVDTPKLILQVPANGSIVLYGSDCIFNVTTSLYITATSGYLPTDNTPVLISLIGTVFYNI